MSETSRASDSLSEAELDLMSPDAIRAFDMAGERDDARNALYALQAQFRDRGSEIARKDATIAQQAETIRTLRAALVDENYAGIRGWTVCRVCERTLADDAGYDITGHDQECPAKAALAATEGQS